MSLKYEPSSEPLHISAIRKDGIPDGPASRGEQVRETGILLPNNQRQHRISHAPKDVPPLRICANYCAPFQENKSLVSAFVSTSHY